MCLWGNKAEEGSDVGIIQGEVSGGFLVNVCASVVKFGMCN